MLCTILGLVQIILSLFQQDRLDDNYDMECNEQDDLKALTSDVYDMIKDIRDPEKPNTLEDLDVVCEEGVHIVPLRDGSDRCNIQIDFKPTVPHCNLATLIGLCLRVKLERDLPTKHKVDIFLTKGSHATEEDINKQINDKERIAAAMENPNLRQLVDQCVSVEDS